MNNLSYDNTQYRKETPGTDTVVHFNSAGSSLSPTPVIRTVIDYLRREAQIGGYEAAAEASEKINNTYSRLADLVGAKQNEIAYVDSATRAWNTIVYSISFSPGDRILISQSEYGSNAVSLAQIASRTGAVIEVIPNELDGTISLTKLKNSLDKNVKLVAITHIPAQRGIINPITEIGQIVRQSNAFYLVDACQSVGHIEIDVNKIGCDALTATGRKWLRGPRGSGFFFLREKWISKIEPIMVDLAVADLAKPELMLKNTQLIIRSDIKRFETWERNYAVMLGLGTAVEYALNIGISKIKNIVSELTIMIQKGLSSIDNISIEDPPNNSCGIITISSNKLDISELKNKLLGKNINTSVVHDYDGPLDLPKRNLQTALRISPHYFNSIDDVEQLVNTIQELVR
jgi:cysteine desulfurase / selenocysteine lyase